MSVYLLTHLRPAGGHQGPPWADQKVLGFFSSKEKAEAAILAASRLPGFSDYQSGFVVTEHKLNETAYLNGFQLDDDLKLLRNDPEAL